MADEVKPNPSTEPSAEAWAPAYVSRLLDEKSERLVREGLVANLRKWGIYIGVGSIAAIAFSWWGVNSKIQSVAEAQATAAAKAAVEERFRDVDVVRDYMKSAIESSAKIEVMARTLKGLPESLDQLVDRSDEVAHMLQLVGDLASLEDAAELAASVRKLTKELNDERTAVLHLRSEVQRLVADNLSLRTVHIFTRVAGFAELKWDGRHTSFVHNVDIPRKSSFFILNFTAINKTDSLLSISVSAKQNGKVIANYELNRVSSEFERGTAPFLIGTAEKGILELHVHLSYGRPPSVDDPRSRNSEFKIDNKSFLSMWGLTLPGEPSPAAANK